SSHSATMSMKRPAPGFPPSFSPAARYATRTPSPPATSTAWPWSSPACAISGIDRQRDSPCLLQGINRDRDRSSISLTSWTEKAQRWLGAREAGDAMFERSPRCRLHQRERLNRAGYLRGFPTDENGDQDEAERRRTNQTANEPGDRHEQADRLVAPVEIDLRLNKIGNQKRLHQRCDQEKH